MAKPIGIIAQTGERCPDLEYANRMSAASTTAPIRSGNIMSSHIAVNAVDAEVDPLADAFSRGGGLSTAHSHNFETQNAITYLLVTKPDLHPQLNAICSMLAVNVN